MDQEQLSERDRVAQARVEDLRMRLLDLTNANRLLNYKFGDRSRRQIRVIDISPDYLLSRLEEGKRLTFESLPDIGENPEDEKAEEFVQLLDEGRLSDEDYLQSIKNISGDEEGEELRRAERTLRDRIRKQLGMPDRLLRDQLSKAEWAQANKINPSFDLVSDLESGDGKLQTLLLPEEMERLLSTIYDQARSGLQETGVNTLYLALGYLQWYESPTANTPFYAPILLHPVDFDRKIARGKYRYSAGSLGEETETNITLSERLNKDFRIRLPEYEEEESPEDYFKRVERLVEDMPRWKVRRFAVVGHFSFARLVMFNDLQHQNWHGGRGIVGSSVIGKLLGGEGSASAGFLADEYDVDNPQIAGKVTALVTDADSSQFSAIVDAMEGKNLAIKGPPGTGKSQTITNVIAAAMAAKKTVLFVAEKMAALNVVKARLEQAKLGEFCLELHSTKARKKDVLESLARRIELQNRIRLTGDLSAATAEIERSKQALSDYVSTMNRQFGGLGKTINSILWSEQKSRLVQGDLPKAIEGIELTDVVKLTEYDISDRKAKLDLFAQAEDAAFKGGSADQHPWFGLRRANLGYFDREQIGSDIEMLREIAMELADGLAAVRGRVGEECSQTVASAQVLAEVLPQIPDETAPKAPDVFARLANRKAFEALNDFRLQQNKWNEAVRRLLELIEDSAALPSIATKLDELISIAKQVPSRDRAFGELVVESERLRTEAGTIKQLLDIARRFTSEIPIDEAITAKSLRSLIVAAKFAASLTPGLLELRHAGLNGDDAGAHLELAIEKVGKFKVRHSAVALNLEFSLDGSVQTWRSHANALRAAKFPSYFWNTEIRAARRFHTSISRAKRKRRRPEMAEDFEAIADCSEISQGLAGNANLRAVCGSHFEGVDTPFERLLVVNKFAVAVKYAHAGEGNIERRIREVLLKAPSETLVRLASLLELPIVAEAEKLAADLHDDSISLEVMSSKLEAQADVLAKLCDKGLALGFKVQTKIQELWRAAEDLSRWAKAAAAIERNADARTVLGGHWNGPETNPALVSDALEMASAIEKANLPSYLREFLFSEDKVERTKHVKELLALVADAVVRVKAQWAIVKERGQINEAEFFGGGWIECSLPSAIGRLERAIRSMDELSVWVEWLSAKKDCEESGLGTILAAFKQEHSDSERISASFDRVYWRSLARAALQQHPGIAKLRGLQLEKVRARFQQLDRQVIDLQRSALAVDLSKRNIDRGTKGLYRKEDTGLELINHELGKQKRHIPLRNLFERAGRAIQDMKPCFMMSPLTVAQFLKQNTFKFDLVVIDEASQMRPEEALGAIARADQLVVVGDPMQLPPTSFFDNGERLPDQDIDEEEVVDSESILDLALSEFRPARDLRWHYRSRHESLVAFSNRKFYDDRLIVFPSPLDPERDLRRPQLGVYHRFVGGRYKGRVNIAEAEAVAEAAIELMKSEGEKSLGIVTLNQSQRELVLAEIERRIAKDRGAQEYVERWEGTLEPFIVKNLENVQGDERDVIFISTVYGPDAETGVVMNRFGPINSKHGHRRLNVLFTRAKDRIVLFTSLRPADVRITETSQAGVHALRSYLEYAETGRLEQGEITGRSTDSDFEDWVRERLAQRGFETVPQVGVAGYFIDLAVKHPARSGFLVGIECDGATYHSSRSARDRDRLRQEVLERLKWKIYRIWSTDWFQNPDEELRKLVNYIEKALENN